MRIHLLVPLMLTFLLAIPVNPEQLMAQRRNPQTPLKSSQVLHDFRVVNRTQPLRITPATQKSVLSKVFRKYLTDDSRCTQEFESSDTDHLRAARNAGQMVPSIIDMAQGSFTGPLRQETLYVIAVNECNASHADNFGSKRVAIFLGSQLITDMDVEFRSNILRKTDLDSDGVDELLMTMGDINQGVLIEIGALLDFRNGRLRVIQDVGTVVEDSCASGFPGSSSKAVVVSYSSAAPGKMPKLRIDAYEASCRRVKRWRFVSTGKMMDE